MVQQTTIIVGTLVALVVIGLFVYLMTRSSSSGGGGTGPAAPSGIRLSASSNGGGDCSSWNATLSWSASTGSAPITYTWALYANPTNACGTTGCTGTPVATGTTTDTQVVLDTTEISGFTSYGAVVTASNAWGQVASTPITVTTGGGFVVDAAEVDYIYDSANNIVVVVGQANTPLPTDGFSATLSVNGTTQSSTTDTFVDQSNALIGYAMLLVQTNNTLVAVQLANGSGTSIVQYVPSGSASWTFTTAGGGSTGQLTNAEMFDPTQTNSPANVVVSMQVGSLQVYDQNFNTTTLAQVSNGLLCASSNATCGAVPPAGSFGLVFTDVPALAAGDVLVASMAAGNSWTGSCNATLPSYTIAGTPPSVPGSVTLSP